MNRRSARAVALALLCLVALVVAAATLTTVQPGGGNDGGPLTGGSGAEDMPDRSESETDRGDERGGVGGGGVRLPTFCGGPLGSDAAVGVLVIGVLVASSLGSRRFGRRIVLGVVLALSPLLLLLAVLLLGGCADVGAGTTSGAGVNATSEGGSGSPFGGGDGDGAVPATAVPTLALLSVALLAIGGALVTIFSADAGEREPDPDDDRSAEERRSEIGRAAGRAADRIEGGDDFENDVYRAWREMAAALPVDRPSSSTPGEFAAAARDAGVDADDAAELTELFEAVRYGGREATSDREERAVAALRRVESSYGGDDDG